MSGGSGEKRRRGRPPLSEGPSTRDQILQTAREVFSERGFARTTFKEIAERAGVTRPAVNHYFHNKESLYRALFDSSRNVVIGSGAAEAMSAETLPARISAFLHTAAQIDSQDRSFARFMASSVLDGFRHPELRDSARSQLDDVRRFVDEALRAAVAAGEIRADLDIPAVTEMLIAVLWGMGLYAGFVGTHDQLESVVAQFSQLLEGTLF
ncbi:TetR/AcrR family transcriptional regulator [Amycolatopsis cynarae]|uniref:TetR/AcrR family transcriptional regulator n=1 Tax=Amycolatopsis cynarae TaxID=2995223 RepID=A0ABY7AXX2_9PSEU|nr:TetR/AcrR family transcriptional regulator [Amycolatopsis sp. HUAS 11-8]WAL64323.1 TetR/AcrR family transcriptional regulator [Amycolatopsis sp. HUAS 11-8]